MELPVGGLGEGFEQVFKVAAGFQAVAFCGFEDAVKDGCGFAGGFVADEQPVFGSELGRTDSIFHEVVVGYLKTQFV